MVGKVEGALVDGIREKGCIHLALIDPEKFSNNLADIVADLESHGTLAIMIGGSTLKSSAQLDKTVKTMRLLFPSYHSLSQRTRGDQQIRSRYLLHVPPELVKHSVPNRVSSCGSFSGEKVQPRTNTSRLHDRGTVRNCGE